MKLYVLEERDRTTNHVVTYQITRNIATGKKWLWTKHVNRPDSAEGEYNETRLYCIIGNTQYRVVEQETI